MDFSWQYPLFLLPHDQGYASLLDRSTATPRQSLIVCTGPELAIELMTQFAMLGAPRALRDHREFRWLLQSLQEPVTHVAFDPEPTDDAVNATFRTSVKDLLTRHLPNDLSPWNYPVYAIGLADGFACIETDAASSLRAVGIFTSANAAEAYLQDARLQGELLELTDLDTTVTFLAAIKNEIAAVAVDPHVVADRCRTDFCSTIDVLLAKYLVREA